MCCVQAAVAWVATTKVEACGTRLATVAVAMVVVPATAVAMAGSRATAEVTTTVEATRLLAAMVNPTHTVSSMAVVRTIDTCCWFMLCLGTKTMTSLL